MNRLKFEELNLSPLMLKAVKDMGFEETTPIQSESIPLLLKGFDLTGHAQTGTGKTAAFAIPIIDGIQSGYEEIQALVLCPTRELVIQVTDEFRKLLKYNDDIFVVPVYGGQEIERQFRALKKNPQIIIGTPGRLMDHIDRGSIKLGGIKFVVLDEADEMLDMGFRDDIEYILQSTPESRQTVMFSATMPEQIKKLMLTYQNDPKIVDVTHHKLHAPKIEQLYFDIPERSKPEALARLIDLHNIKLALVFCNTKSKVDTLVEILKSRGYFADALHGDLGQSQREKVMNSFRNGSTEILVATDVAGRGIDVNDVEAVFNYDLPRDDEDYIHRIGRTGRAGKEGIAFTFVVGKELQSLKRIEKENGIKIQRKDIPTIGELDETRLDKIAKDVKKVIDDGHITKFVYYVDRIMGDDYSSIDIASALLKITLDVKNEGFNKEEMFHEAVDKSERDRKKDRGRGRDRKRGSRSERTEGRDRNRGGRSERTEGRDRKRGGRSERTEGRDRKRGSRSEFERTGDRERKSGNEFKRKKSVKNTIDDFSFLENETRNMNDAEDTGKKKKGISSGDFRVFIPNDDYKKRRKKKKSFQSGGQKRRRGR